MPPLALADVAAQTGLTTDAIRDLARTIVSLDSRGGDRGR